MIDSRVVLCVGVGSEQGNGGGRITPVDGGFCVYQGCRKADRGGRLRIIVILCCVIFRWVIPSGIGDGKQPADTAAKGVEGGDGKQGI